MAGTVRQRRGTPEDADPRCHRHRRLGQIFVVRRGDPSISVSTATASKIAVLAIDPSKRKSGGALLADRIRMNAITHRKSTCARSRPANPTAKYRNSLPHAAEACRAAASISSLSRLPASARATPPLPILPTYSLYVMTPEFGAASQLEKIDMLDFADLVAINKIRSQGRRRRAARRSQAGSAQSESIYAIAGHVAGLWRHRGAFPG